MNYYKNKRLGIIINLDNVIRLKFIDEDFRIEVYSIGESPSYALHLTKEEYEELKIKSFNSQKRFN